MPTPASEGAVVEAISQARLALRAGDVDLAISHLSSAARHDRNGSLVLKTAQAIVQELLARAEQAANDGHWQIADGELERARELSLRFEFSTQEIDRAARRFSSMERFRRLQPSDVDAIRAAVGKRVVLYYKSGKTWSGRIHGVSGRTLEIDQYTEIGSDGKVYYVEDVPLVQLEELRVFDDEPP